MVYYYLSPLPASKIAFNQRNSDNYLIMNDLKANKTLELLAKRYVWWETPEWAYRHPTVFLANVMNLGTWEDIQALLHIFNTNTLREVLIEAPPGYFNTRSWDFWHLKLKFESIPPLPKRSFL